MESLNQNLITLIFTEVSEVCYLVEQLNSTTLDSFLVGKQPLRVLHILVHESIANHLVQVLVLRVDVHQNLQVLKEVGSGDLEPYFGQNDLLAGDYVVFDPVHCLGRIQLIEFMAVHKLDEVLKIWNPSLVELETNQNVGGKHKLFKLMMGGVFERDMVEEQEDSGYYGAQRRTIGHIDELKQSVHFLQVNGQVTVYDFLVNPKLEFQGVIVPEDVLDVVADEGRLFGVTLTFHFLDHFVNSNRIKVFCFQSLFSSSVLLNELYDLSL